MLLNKYFQKLQEIELNCSNETDLFAANETADKGELNLTPPREDTIVLRNYELGAFNAGITTDTDDTYSEIDELNYDLNYVAMNSYDKLVYNKKQIFCRPHFAQALHLVSTMGCNIQGLDITRIITSCTRNFESRGIKQNIFKI